MENFPCFSAMKPPRGRPGKTSVKSSADRGLRRGCPGPAGSHATDARHLRQKRRGNGVVGAPQGGPGDAWWMPWRVPWVGVVDILKAKMMMECDFNGIEWMYLFGDSMGLNGDWYGLLVDMFYIV